MSANEKIPADWREKELNLEEVIKKHPNVPPFVILKTDLLRRGAFLSENVKKALNPENDALYARGIYGDNHEERPNGLTLRDGTTVVGSIEIRTEFNGGVEPYTIDLADGKTVITDNGKVIEDVYFWPKPDYYDKVTTSGRPMWQVLVARPQRMDINIYQYCDFWDEPGEGCKFCSIIAAYNWTKGGKSKSLDIEDVAEAVEAAVSQPGRFRMIQMCAGSILSGDELLDDEVDQYIKLLQRLERIFHSKKVMTQLIATAYNERQLRRLYNETILSSYTADIEILNEEIFNWVCPGKARRIGYKGWRDSLFKAAEIFGPNAVNTGIVSGAEMARPNGFKTEEEALEAYLAESEYFIQHGVGIAQTVFRSYPGCIFHNQKAPSLDYLVSYAEGLDALQRKYRLEAYFDDYRTCGNHPNTDLARI
ncbi:MAG: hypothetical protein LBU85_02565 [Treponema sp.]|jgi:hypothetical protein|nr:hypothetical protein [Treponema sp.]